MMQKPRAIIFDDDDAIRSMLTRYFVMRGYECHSFDDPAAFCPVNDGDGASCANCNPHRDILITDINMPAMNGLDFLEIQLRHGCTLDSRNKAVMSGDLQEPHRKRLQRLGHPFFKKPFTIKTIADWLAECEQRPQQNPAIPTWSCEERRCR